MTGYQRLATAGRWAAPPASNRYPPGSSDRTGAQILIATPVNLDAMKYEPCHEGMRPHDCVSPARKSLVRCAMPSRMHPCRSDGSSAWPQDRRLGQRSCHRCRMQSRRAPARSPIRLGRRRRWRAKWNMPSGCCGYGERAGLCATLTFNRRRVTHCRNGGGAGVRLAKSLASQQ